MQTYNISIQDEEEVRIKYFLKKNRPDQPRLTVKQWINSLIEGKMDEINEFYNSKRKELTERILNENPSIKVMVDTKIDEIEANEPQKV